MRKANPQAFAARPLEAMGAACAMLSVPLESGRRYHSADLPFLGRSNRGRDLFDLLGEGGGLYRRTTA